MRLLYKWQEEDSQARKGPGQVVVGCDKEFGLSTKGKGKSWEGVGITRF